MEYKTWEKRIPILDFLKFGIHNSIKSNRFFFVALVYSKQVKIIFFKNLGVSLENNILIKGIESFEQLLDGSDVPLEIP